jgi:hypothetical protein
MNPKSPIPLWLALCVGVVFLAGVYVLAQRTVAPPQASVMVKRLTATPQGSVSSTLAGIPQGTGNAVLPATSTIDLQNSCRNERRRFQLIYPSRWKMYSPGPPEAKPVSCNDDSAYHTSATRAVSFDVSSSPPEREHIIPSQRQPTTANGGSTLARRRYQQGTLFLRGKNKKVWVGRWREDEMLADGTVRRINRNEVLGTMQQYPTKRLAQRALEQRIAAVNRPEYRPQVAITFRHSSRAGT